MSNVATILAGLDDLPELSEERQMPMPSLPKEKMASAEIVALLGVWADMVEEQVWVMHEAYDRQRALKGLSPIASKHKVPAL